jgi:hypothetical protein
MQLRVDVNADGKVLATVLDNELQVKLAAEYVISSSNAKYLAKHVSEQHAWVELRRLVFGRLAVNTLKLLLIHAFTLRKRVQSFRCFVPHAEAA